VLGNDVTVCAGATVTSAEVGDGACVGAGAVVLAGAKVGAGAFVDAGAVVPPGAVVPAGSLWTGNPARQLRMLSLEEMSYLRSSAAMHVTLGARHTAQWAKSAAALEAEAEEAELKRERGLKPTDSLPTPDADVVEYYKLTEVWPESGLFRTKEKNVAAETALLEADEVAADKAEEAYYAAVARGRRIGASLKALSAARPDRPGARDKVLAELAAADPADAASLKELVGRMTAAAASGDAAAKAELIATVRRVDPDQSYYEDDKEAEAAATAMFDAAVAHGKTLALPAAATVAAGSVAAAAAAAARPMA